MILDSLENIQNYASLNPHFGKAFNFLLNNDLKSLELSRHEIDGDLVYATAVQALGRSKEEAKLETHQKYIDIQVVLSGTDTMGWKSAQACTSLDGDYNQEKDLQLYSDSPDAWLATGAGAFAIFFPQDAHMPMVSDAQLHKVIVKVAVS